MLQNLDAESDDTSREDGRFLNYTESSAHTEGIGNVGQACEIPPQTFSGFTVRETAMVRSGTELKATPILSRRVRTACISA